MAAAARRWMAREIYHRVQPEEDKVRKDLKRAGERRAERDRERERERERIAAAGASQGAQLNCARPGGFSLPFSRFLAAL